MLGQRGMISAGPVSGSISPSWLCNKYDTMEGRSCSKVHYIKGACLFIITVGMGMGVCVLVAN